MEKVLSSSSLFKDFTEEDFKHLLPLSQVVTFDKKDTIIHQGDVDDKRIFFLLSGSVSVWVDKRYILTLSKPWDIFGEMSICSAEPRSASVIADTPVQLLVIDASIIHNPEHEKNYQFKYYFYNMFAAIMSKKLQITSDRAKLYEDAIFQAKQIREYTTGLESRLEDNLHEILLYSHMVNSSWEGILILDLDGIITKVNPSIQVLFRHREFEIVGHPLKDFIIPSTYSSLEKTINSVQPSYSGEIEIKCTENEKFPAHISLSAIKNNQQEKIAYSCIIRDITQQKEYESKILNQKKELEEAYANLQVLDRMKDDFLTLMSHELRTPLSSILGYTELLTTPDILGPEDQASFHSSIHTEAKRLEKLITKVLNLSKLENDSLIFSFRSGNIKPVVEDVVESFSAQAKEKGLVLKSELSEPPDFNFDKDRIVDVMENLLENAINFTDQGEVKIQMTYDSDYTTILVQDTGIGIAQEDVPKVFNKFEMIEDMAYHHRGLGLGMPLSKLIIEAHQGQIRLESQLGKGTSFYCTLSHHLQGEETDSSDDFEEEDFSALL